MENLKLYENFISDREDMINEAKKSEKGLMHKLLGIPEDKKISDVYTSGSKLAKDLMQAVKDAKIVPAAKVRAKATSMLAFAGNWPKEGKDTVIDKALEAIKKTEIPGVPVKD
jgi:hypothetical protein